jgi:hypothetical protein
MSAPATVLDLPLDRLQRWMQAVIVHPGPPEEAVRTSVARALVPDERLADVILPSKTLRPEERLAIYHGMYPLRMRDALLKTQKGLESTNSQLQSTASQIRAATTTLGGITVRRS